MAAPAGPAPRHGFLEAVAALRHRDFALFWSGALLSNIGTWMQNITVPFVLYKMTGSATWIGFAAFMQFLPGVLLAPVAGSLADRFDRRIVLMISQVVAAVFALGLWAAFELDRATPWTIVILVTLTGTTFGLTVASWQALVTELVPRDALLNAITLNSAQFNGARALGPALGGWVLGRWGPSWAFLVNALSYVAVLGALAVIESRPRQYDRPTGRVMRQFQEGLVYIRANAGIALAMVLVAAVGFLGSPVFQLAPVLTRDVFHVGASAYGVLTGALGGGAVVGAALLGSFGGGFRRSSLVAIAMAGYGLALTALGLAPSFGVGVACMALTGMGYLAVVATLQTTVQLLVTETLRGRVLAVYVMVFTLAYPLGALVQGQLADRIGVQWTIAGAGVILTVLGLLLVAWPRRARSMDDRATRDDATSAANPIAAA